MKKMYKKPESNVEAVIGRSSILQIVLNSNSAPQPGQQSGNGVSGRRPDITV